MLPVVLVLVAAEVPEERLATASEALELAVAVLVVAVVEQFVVLVVETAPDPTAPWVERKTCLLEMQQQQVVVVALVATLAIP